MIWFLRRLPIVAALACAIAVLVWLDHDNDFRREMFPARSIHNISPKGASLAFRYLKETRRPNDSAVNELNRRIDFARLEPDAVVLRLGPEFKPGERKDDGTSGKKAKKSGTAAPPGPATTPATTPAAKPARVEPLLTDGEMAWVKSGGRLVLVLDENYGPVSIVPHSEAPRIAKTTLLWPGINSFRPGAQGYAQQWPARTLKGDVLNDAPTLFTLNDGVFVARLELEKGEVIFFAAPEIFANSHLGDGDNLALLLQLAPADRPVYFDEFVHGMKGKPGIIELLSRWGLGVALLVMCVGGAILFWRARTAIGPPEDDHKETRTQAIDFVNSLAPLYNRVLEPHQAIALHYKNFIHAVTVQSGLRGTDLRVKLFSLLETNDESGLSGQRALNAEEFYSLLKTLNEAYGRLERAHRR